MRQIGRLLTHCMCQRVIHEFTEYSQLETMFDVLTMLLGSQFFSTVSVLCVQTRKIRTVFVKDVHGSICL